MRRLIAGVSAIVLALVAGVLVGNAVAYDPYIGGPEVPGYTDLNTCFWYGPYGAGETRNNIALPDEYVTYWAADLQDFPIGASVVPDGEFSFGRHNSLNLYNTEGEPTASILDTEMVPEPGSTNPFLPGADRLAEDRAFRMWVVNDAAIPDSVPPEAEGIAVENTLITGGDERVTVLWRVYVPDRGLNALGGVDLPEPTVILPDGETLTGEDACRYNPEITTLSSAAPPLGWYTLDLSRKRNIGDYSGPEWYRSFSTDATTECAYGLLPDDWPEGQDPCDRRNLSPDDPLYTVDRGQEYSTQSNAYIYKAINTDYGDIVVIQGRMPVTAETLDNVPQMPAAEDYDLRYWSLCANEGLATGSVEECLFDEEIPLNEDREYTIVVSSEQNRPPSATDECGVAWMSTAPQGDGISRLVKTDRPFITDRGQTILVIRHMLPSDGFDQSVFDVPVAGAEEDTLGPYYPRLSYTSVEGFEDEFGCQPQ